MRVCLSGGQPCLFGMPRLPVAYCNCCCPFCFCGMWSDVQISRPKLEVSPCVWYCSQARCLLWWNSGDEECSWQPFLCRQHKVFGCRCWGWRRWCLSCASPRKGTFRIVSFSFGFRNIRSVCAFRLCSSTTVLNERSGQLSLTCPRPVC